MKLRPLVPLVLALSATPLAYGEEADSPGDEQLAPGQTVQDRVQPEYEPTGVRAGTFLVYPQVKLEEQYDDNIYYSNTNEREDWLTVISPTLRVTSDWSRHALELDLGSDLTRYDKFSTEDNDHYWATAKGRIDLTSHTIVTLMAERRNETEGRGTPDAVNGIDPTRTRSSDFELAFEHRPGRFFVQGSVDVKQLDYSNVQTSVGTVINNHDRDRRENEASLTLGYEIVPEYDAFVRYVHGDRNYDQTVDDNGYVRDSTSDSLLIGTELDFTGVLTGEVAIGAMHYDYDDPSFDNVSKGTAKALLYWYATPLTTATFQLERSVGETTTPTSSGYISDTLGVSVYHELLRNLVLQASLSATQNSYDGFPRTDDITTFQASGEYDVNRNLFLGAGYEYNQRDSNFAGVDYKHNVLSAWVGLRY